MKLQKHKIIAEAFTKRKKFNQGGRIEIECQNYSDPVGLHFDLNSAASNGLSTTFVANLPRLVNRRGAMINDNAYSVSSNNHSLDSEVSLNVRHVSIESRCNSGDSQLSVQIAELKATRKVNGRRHRNRLRRKHEFRRNSRDVGASSRRLSKTGNKKGSSTSLDSHLQLINALTNTCDVKTLGPNLKRRTGNAGLDGQHINNLLSNGKLVIPYNMNVKSGSEDENVSVTISESRFNMVVSNTNNFDLNDELVMKSLKRGLHIEELNTSSSDSEKEQKKMSCNRSGRESLSSRRSKRSKKSRKKFNSNSDSLHSENTGNEQSDSDSSCPEIKQLL